MEKELIIEEALELSKLELSKADVANGNLPKDEKPTSLKGENPLTEYTTWGWALTRDAANNLWFRGADAPITCNRNLYELTSTQIINISQSSVCAGSNYVTFLIKYRG